jgi:hypothetical protein
VISRSSCRWDESREIQDQRSVHFKDLERAPIVRRARLIRFRGKLERLDTTLGTE